MNKQGPNGIEYVHQTHNVPGGCFYGCQWDMPDGKRIQCYAKSTAEGLAQKAYPPNV